MQTLTPLELHARLNNGDNPLLLDVREPREFSYCQIAGSINLPLSGFAESHGKLDAQSEIVVICHHGMRSLQAARFLESKGFLNVSNLEGGIDGWATTVDTDMPRY